MNQIRHYIRKMLAEAHYTTWNSLEESSPIDGFNGGQAEVVKKLAKQLGIDKIAPLGSGTQGYAYYIPNNRVLKITKDKSEVAEAFKIKGKKLKHLANVYEAFTLGGKYEGIYVVILEFLNKSEAIDNADQLLEHFLDVEFGYGISFFFEDYSNGSMSKEEIKEYEKNIKDFYAQAPESASEAIWYMKEKFGIIDDIRRSRIKSTDWGLTNLGLKKDGHLAMYDLGYGDPNIPDSVQNINLKQEDRLSRNDYPNFFDSQFNKDLKNTPFPPVANVNNAPLREDVIDNEELNKKDLPHKFPELFKDFVKEKTDAEIKEIAPAIDFSQEPEYLVRNLETNYPALFDNFSDWLFDRKKNQTTFK